MMMEWTSAEKLNPPAPMHANALGRLIASFEDLVDPVTGIIQYVYEQPKEPGGPEFFRYIARACDTRAFGRWQNFSAASAAAGTREMALAKTIGEALERYCAAIFEREEFRISSWRNADFPAVSPREWSLYSAEQYAAPGFMFRPFDEDARTRWCPALDLASGATLYVPACFVFVPYTFSRADGEVPITQPISTGLACHGSFADAAAGAICEVIERDAFTITWQARLSHPRIRTESLSATNRDLVRRLNAAGYEVVILDATSDSQVPVILVVLTNPNAGGLPLVVSASCELSPELAVRKALEESAHTERYIWHICQTTPPVPFMQGHGNVVDQVTHLRFWTDPSRLEFARFLFDSPISRDFCELQDRSTEDAVRDLETLQGLVAKTGHRVLVAELTTADVRQLGFHVVRALIPGYHPLHMGFSVRARGGHRLHKMPAVLGYRKPGEPWEENPFPHPFP